MSVVLAAVDAAAAQPVLAAAVRLRALTGARLEAVHVLEPASGPDRALGAAAQLDVALRVVEGDVRGELLAACRAPGVVVAVIGRRPPGRGRHPVGQMGRLLLEHVSVPVLVVPPGAAIGELRRVTVPLEGRNATSRAIAEQLQRVVPDPELVVVHVFPEDAPPAMLDRPGRDLDMWGREFLRRHLPAASHIELRHGPVGRLVVEAAGQHGAGMIALGWSQDSSRGRARVVREVLATSDLPVLLLPLGTTPTEFGTAPGDQRH